MSGGEPEFLFTNLMNTNPEHAAPLQDRSIASAIATVLFAISA